ncbi:NAD(P)-binding protein [Dissoconium aciculare CBS 342.82]|uniref:NAD(P)-binding protein n=1 Tax=Dissoconium aciculare CBS 342.82 TaxID=1314786 RepID=A0A6J3MB40_9PEZI|nr:NAD(P)-binding protein [Dissoconium aciculare CBS 342.82]KAF1825073.1 NAD(P)-binding protein [Dissoconium aciculare CBS 342.82]
MADEWGTNNIQSFIPKQTTTGPDISQVRLPSPFTVVIVGASRGIGAGIATSYARAGATGLLLASRRISGLEATAAACRGLNPSARVEIASCDITSAADVEALAERARGLFHGRLDVVVVNAGFSGTFTTDLLATDPAEFAQAASVNYLGLFHCAKYLLPGLAGCAGGARAFVAVCSLAAGIVRGPIANAMYCVSKTAQMKLAEHVHEQFHAEGKGGVNVLTVHPGAVKSEMAEGAPDEFKDFLIDDVELCGRFCVWVTKDGEEGRRRWAWLSGRLVSATWDVEGLEAKREEVVKGNLLKLALTTS